MKQRARSGIFLALALYCCAPRTCAQLPGIVKIYFDKDDSVMNPVAKNVLDSLISNNVLYPGRRFTIVALAFEEMSPADHNSILT